MMALLESGQFEDGHGHVEEFDWPIEFVLQLTLKTLMMTIKLKLNNLCMYRILSHS